MTRTRGAAIAGAGLLATSAAVHIDLYVTGYRHIPTIGDLFLVQAVAGLAMALLVVVTSSRERSWLHLAACASAGMLALGTVGAYLYSLHSVLFGFHETTTPAGSVAGAAELGAALLLLGSTAVTSGPKPRRTGGAALLLVVAVGSSLLAAGGPKAPANRVDNVARDNRTTVTLTVTIHDFAFHPDVVMAHPGERIRVLNLDPVVHTLTSERPGDFNSGPIAPHTSRVLVVPRVAGRYPFFCAIHQYMTGTLTVS